MTRILVLTAEHAKGLEEGASRADPLVETWWVPSAHEIAVADVVGTYVQIAEDYMRIVCKHMVLENRERLGICKKHLAITHSVNRLDPGGCVEFSAGRGLEPASNCGGSWSGGKVILGGPSGVLMDLGLENDPLGRDELYSEERKVGWLVLAMILPKPLPVRIQDFSSP